MPEVRNRREFLKDVTLAAGIATLGGVWTEGARAQSKSPNDALNVAHIGVGGQGGGDLGTIGSIDGVNIVALCDVDEDRAAGSFRRFPKAQKYNDFREMLEKEQKNIDAVVVSTPDNCHAVAAVMAMKLGKHVYCQKPLAHDVYEARFMTEIAAKHKIATQMGTQGRPQYVRTVEFIKRDVIGPVREVHVWTDRPAGWWPQGIERPTDTPPIPSTLHWDLWLGPAAERPYNPAYLPFIWRGWWDFGTGALGDMACHLMDCAFWALDLKYPLSVVAESEGATKDSPPKWSVIHYEFPARGSQPPVTLTWYDGGKRPSDALLEGHQVAPTFNGSLFVGEKGKILVEHGGDPMLLPEERNKGFNGPDPFLPRSPGHYVEWVNACKTGSPTGSHFGYAGPMTETVLLGNVALRVGKKIEWDARHLKAVHCPEADAYLRRKYRKGWTL
ncbi:MAG TPA: Gfo/Idh/MocA family oxidoreductase [Chthonomonadaceae bacterium]|nr:Gfo/Idh/MocA family oxidoreductase [Chthonomonadaceae bacterium]